MSKLSIISKVFSRFFNHMPLYKTNSQQLNYHHMIIKRLISSSVNSYGDVKSATEPINSKPSPQTNKAKVTVTFVKNSGERITAIGKEGDNLLDIVINNNVDLDGYGACEGTLACSTCHLIFEKEDYDRIKEKPTDEEMDMLDLAYELTDTSRLGCQCYMTKELDGLVVRVPAGVNDARS